MNQTNRRRAFFVVVVLIGIFVIALQQKERHAIVAAGLGPEIPKFERPEKKQAVKIQEIQKAEPAPQIDLEAFEEIRGIAKSNLAQVYTASRAFHSEFGRFSTDLKAIGWDPDEALMKVKVGFQTSFKPDKFADSADFQEDLRRIDSDSFNGTRLRNSEEIYSYTATAEAIRLSDYRSYCEEDCSASEDHLELMVVVPLPNGKVDVWTVNENKEMKLKLDGSK